MRTSAGRARDWRWFGWFAVTLFFAFVIMLTGCATAPRSSGYDGVPDIPPLNGDNVTLVRVTIHNLRTIDPIDPTIYLVGSGRNSLGRIGGMGGELNKWVDPSWLGPEGCFTIVAHYPGGRDLVFDKFCMKRGERIEATLSDLFNPTASWSHR